MHYNARYNGANRVIAVNYEFKEFQAMDWCKQNCNGFRRIVARLKFRCTKNSLVQKNNNWVNTRNLTIHSPSCNLNRGYCS